MDNIEEKIFVGWGYKNKKSIRIDIDFKKLGINELCITLYIIPTKKQKRIDYHVFCPKKHIKYLKSQL